MKLLDQIKGFFLSLIKPKKEPKPIERRNAEGKVVTPPVPLEKAVKELPVEPAPIIAEDAPWVYPGNHSYVADLHGGQKLLQTPENKPIGIVLHHTASYTLDSTVRYLKNNKVAVHFVIGHDGKVVQMVQCNKHASHAGDSQWNGKRWLNNFYVGIEVVNIGWLKKKSDGTFEDGYGREWKGKVRYRNIEGYSYWEPFTEDQEKAMTGLCLWLIKTYNIPIENIAAHYEVSPGRKNDPAGGMSMSMDQFRKLLAERV